MIQARPVWLVRKDARRGKAGNNVTRGTRKDAKPRGREDFLGGLALRLRVFA